MIHQTLQIACVVLCLGGCAYWLAAWYCTAALLRPISARGVRKTNTLAASPTTVEGTKPANPRVSVLKPVKGRDEQAYENFASFCRQDFDGYEILFGVAEPDDPVVSVIRRLQSDFPDRQIRLLVVAHQGANPKCSILRTLQDQAAAPLLVISDSDVRVEPDCLSRVTAPLGDPAVGLVTCPYRSAGASGFAGSLAGLQMDVGFLPAVALAHRLGQRVCMGATLALRRCDLLRGGGYERIVDHLMDDYMLAVMTEELGLKIRLSDSPVDCVLGPVRFRDQWARELRWARGIRVTEPLKYWGLALTFPAAWAVLVLAVAGFDSWAAAMLAAVLLLRWIIAVSIAGLIGKSGSYPNPVLLLARDLMSFAIWCGGAFGQHVVWRGKSYLLAHDGKMTPVQPAMNERNSRKSALAVPILRLDALLRHRLGIFEFCDAPGCLLRVSVGVCDESTDLSDGSKLSPGDPVCDLHIYNEHLPWGDGDTFSLAWAKRAERELYRSLSALARAVRTDPRLQHVRAIRGETSFALRRGVPQLRRVARRMHFDLRDPTAPVSLFQRLHFMGQDLLLWGLMVAFSPRGVRRSARLARKRHRLLMSRETLLCHYDREA